MRFKATLFYCLLGFFFDCVFAVTDSEKILELERRVATLETTLNGLEPLFVARYGLIRHCLKPDVANGEALCAEKLEPGARCSVICNPGYIATPDKEYTYCQEDGIWARDLQCEIPLVLVSGGTVDQGNSGDSDVEVLSFYPSSGCDRDIPDMPLAEGSVRSLHNLEYLPIGRMLACNGMTSKNEATCDIWSRSTNTWEHHSYPNKGSSVLDAGCRGIWDSGIYHSYGCDGSKDRKKGRYASESLHVGEDIFNFGGMEYDDKGHEPSDSIRYLRVGVLGNYWDKPKNMAQELEKKRAFFCSVKIKEAGFLSIGGLGHDGQTNIVEQSAEYIRVNSGIESIYDVSNMSIPRSGHGCSGVPGDDISVLVSGGTTEFGGNALAYAEIFNWETNSWKNVAEMKTGRIGHAVVAVGKKIFAIGGDENNPSNILDTIEEYNAKKDAWKVIKKKLKKPRANFGYTLVPHSIFDGCKISQVLDE